MGQTAQVMRPQAANRWVTYRMEINQRSKMGAMTNENIITQQVKKELLTDGEDERVYSVEITDRQQTGSKPLQRMQVDLAAFYDRLVLRTDRSGAIQRVINMLELRDRWRQKRRDFYERFKEEKKINAIIKESDALMMTEGAFEQTLRQSEAPGLLFPPIYVDDLAIGNPINQQRTFDGFFGKTDLPLQLKTTLKSRNAKGGKTHLQRKGWLDREHFEAQALKEQFRELADSPRLAVDPQVDYLETYDLDRRDWISHAGQLFRVRIDELFLFQQMVRITPQDRDA